MNLNEWEIWHTYGAFFGGPKLDLELAAHDIVQSGFAPAALSSSGSAYWLSDGAVHCRPIGLELNDDGTGVAQIPTDATAYGIESLYQAAWFLTSELKLFGRTGASPPAYVRTMPGAVLLIEGDRAHVAYPVVKLYESGVVLISFRVMSPSEPVDVESFVDYHLNVTLRTIDEIDVPTSIAVLAKCANSETRSHFGRLFGARARMRARCLADAVDSQWTYDGDDFEHPMSAPSTGRNGEVVATAPDLAISICDALMYGLSNPTDTLWGDISRPHLLTSVARWSGRPQVHLVKFDGQSEDSDADSQHNELVFASILARGKPKDAAPKRMRLPENLRMGSDQGIFISSSASLWVQSRRGLRRVEATDANDPNRAHLVYENQTIAELLEYGYALHLRLRDESTSVGYDPLRALVAREHLAALANSLRSSSHYGEIQKLLDVGWQEMGVGRLIHETTENLSNRQAIASVIESRRTNRWAAVLTCIFGIGVVPTIANDILIPVWTAFVNPTQAPSSQGRLGFLACAAGIVVLAGLLSLRWVGRR